jgi:hypothetical protein
VFLHLGGGRGDGHVPGGRGKSASSVLESTGTISRFRGGWHSPPSFESRFAVVKGTCIGALAYSNCICLQERGVVVSSRVSCFVALCGCVDCRSTFLPHCSHNFIHIHQQFSFSRFSQRFSTTSITPIILAVALHSLTKFSMAAPSLDLLVLNAAHLPEQPAQLPGCAMLVSPSSAQSLRTVANRVMLWKVAVCALRHAQRGSS